MLIFILKIFLSFIPTKIYLWKKNPNLTREEELGKSMCTIMISMHKDMKLDLKMYGFFLTLHYVSDGGVGIIKELIRSVRYCSLATHMTRYNGMFSVWFCTYYMLRYAVCLLVLPTAKRRQTYAIIISKVRNNKNKPAPIVRYFVYFE